MELKDMSYNGVLIPTFCAEKEIPFKEIEDRFKRMRKNKKLDKYTDEDLIEYIIKTFYSRKINCPFERKYFVGETPLSEFARKNGVSPYSIKGAVHRGLKKDTNANVEELARAFIERNKNKFMYTYEGYPLSIACRKFGLSNVGVLKIFHDNYPDSDNMTEEEINYAIKDIIDTLRETGIKKGKIKGLRYEK